MPRSVTLPSSTTLATAAPSVSGPTTSTRAEAAGSTPAVVFVHGMRTSSAIWREQLDHVHSRGIEALAVDLPAHGARHRERFTLSRSFEVLDEAAASFGSNRRILLVGLSLGGYTSLAWAARRPAGLVGVVAAACTANPKGKPVSLYRDVARTVVAGWQATRRTTRRAGNVWRAGMLGRPITNEAVLDGVGTGATTPPWSIVTDALTELAGQSWLTHMRALDVPVWLINGARDHMRVDEQRYLAVAGQAELVVVPHAGHDVNAHAPAAFNLTLDRALAHVGGATLVA